MSPVAGDSSSGEEVWLSMYLETSGGAEVWTAHMFPVSGLRGPKPPVDGLGLLVF